MNSNLPTTIIFFSTDIASSKSLASKGSIVNVHEDLKSRRLLISFSEKEKLISSAALRTSLGKEEEKLLLSKEEFISEEASPFTPRT